MGKGERNRQQNARERIAAQQAAARKAETTRRAIIAGGSVLVVIAIVVVFVVLKATNKPPKGGHAPVATAALSASVASDITSVSPSVLNQVGNGPTGSSAVDPLQTPVKKAAPLISGGKPEMLYVGAEYCPYCAAERWAMAVALSRFGTFTGLHLIHSSSSDIYSNTMTLSFYQTTYTSKYLTFVPVETTTENENVTLQTPTAAELKLMNTYDAPPYIPAQYKGSFPFIDIGNQYIDDGAQYVPSVLGSTENVDAAHYGLTWSQIAQDLQSANNPVAQAILGTANHLTAAICKMTHGQPGNVCNSAAVTSIKQI